ncbi:MAG: hypothetical protein K9J79_02790 [Desulfobacteraceae bacterium]|nr:hypothetical protein [Desulfobacteraceae bacterium]MCF8094269.1 hypothetical protein [Desulfobacteraceae bacterium]
MRKRLLKKTCLMPAAMLMVLFFTICGYCQDAKVVFECGDIGVQARRVLSGLKKERAEFSRREKEIDKRENELKILQAEVDKKIERLKQLRDELGEMLAEKEQGENEKVKKLSKIYQKREPAAAAASLAAMDKELAVSVLSRMRDKYAGEILDNMEQATAVDYSTSLGQLDK